MFLGVKQRPKKRALFEPFWALFTLLNWPKNPTFRKMHEKQGVTGGSQKTRFFAFFWQILKKFKKKLFGEMRVGGELVESVCEVVWESCGRCVRECWKHEKWRFSAIPKRGVQRALFQDSEQTFREIVGELRERAGDVQRASKCLRSWRDYRVICLLLHIPPPCADAHEHQILWAGGLGLLVRHTDPEDVSSPEGPRVRERIALRTLTSL